MDGVDRDLGWEDVGSQSGSSAGMGGFSAPTGSLGEASSAPGGAVISDAVTRHMMNHFANELTKGSTTMWPQFIKTAQRYFNVHHGYVLRKALWQIAPTTNPKKKSTDGEIGRGKDWTVRIYEGLEVDIEEPDMYIPTMGFATYVLLCGMIKGLQEEFHPDVLYAAIIFAVIILILEVLAAKAALFMAGAVHAPVSDLAALFGYKFFYLAVQLLSGVLFGRGYLYSLLALCLCGSCSIALFQSLRRLARMQSLHGQECVQHVHDIFIKGLPAMQVLTYYLLLPSWPKAAVLEASAASVLKASSQDVGSVVNAAVEAATSFTTTVTTVFAAAASNA